MASLQNIKRRLDALDGRNSASDARQFFVSPEAKAKGREHLCSILPDYYRPDVDSVSDLLPRTGDQFKDVGTVAEFWPTLMARVNGTSRTVISNTAERQS